MRDTLSRVDELSWLIKQWSPVNFMLTTKFPGIKIVCNYFPHMQIVRIASWIKYYLAENSPKIIYFHRSYWNLCIYYIYTCLTIHLYNKHIFNPSYIIQQSILVEFTVLIFKKELIFFNWSLICMAVPPNYSYKNVSYSRLFQGNITWNCINHNINSGLISNIHKGFIERYVCPYSCSYLIFLHYLGGSLENYIIIWVFCIFLKSEHFK